MRFNPDTERALNIDEIAAQCRAAILKSAASKIELYDEVLQFASWEDDVLVAA